MDDIPDITELSKLYLVKAKNSKEDLYYLKVITFTKLTQDDDVVNVVTCNIT